jgi:hypothetical protein
MNPLRAITTLAILTLVSVDVSWAQLMDEPDFGKEAKFHDIYQKFNSAPTSEETWAKAFTDTKPKIYTVNKGDTLWDVSKVLFADPLFWPKIWSFNTSEIMNPHEIKPNWKLQFLPGTLEAPPVLVVAEVEGVKLPPPKRLYPPAAKIPDSLPEYGFNLPVPEKSEFKKLDRSALRRITSLPLPVEIMESRPEVMGEVMEFDDGARVASDTRNIYIKLEDDLGPGVYTSVKSIDKSRYGYVIVYGAEIEVLERINDSENIYRAKILKMINQVEAEDEIIQGAIPNVEVDETPLASQAPLMRIVGGYRSPTDSVFAAYSFVFINGGTDQGLSAGDSLKVYQDPKIRWEKTKIKKAFYEVGKLKLLRVYEDVSTGYILNTQTELREGDFVGIMVSDSGSGTSEDGDELILE